MMKVSVRALCEFAARTGSLEFRYTPAPTAEEGVMGHFAVQQRRPAPYIAEYALNGQCAGLEVSGRADGYYCHEQECYLEEIKTHRGSVSRIGPGRRDLHWAQLKVYGALLCQRDKRDSIALRLTYLEVRDETETLEELILEATELSDYLDDLCQRYINWAKQEAKHRESRDNALLGLDFPHASYRTGQHSLSVAVYRSAKNDLPLLLQAPTGIGKTVGVLFPALKAAPAATLDRVFFLTNRNTGRKLGLDGLRIILDGQTQHVPLRVLEISSKEAACDKPDKACHGDSCPLASGFFDRLPAARQQAVQEGFLDQNALRKIAAEHEICRYFLAQEMAHWCDVVVGDVNHYYDQFALLYSLTKANEWRVMPLVDEAHNLIDRARGMYSIALSEAEMLFGIRKVPKPLVKPLSELENAWELMVRPFLDSEETVEQRRYHLESVPEDLNIALYGLISSITDYLTDNPAAAEVQNVLFTALGFLRLAEKFGDHSLCTLEFDVYADSARAKPGSARLLIDNLVPADHLSQRFTDAASTVLFSATLSPMEYHRDLLGLPQSTRFVDIESPFTREQIDLRIVTDISTQRHHREDSIAPICERIVDQYRAKPGNYLVYLSSFEYLNSVYAGLENLAPEIRLLRQRPGMPPVEREQYIADISDASPSVAFAVLGGVFGEGIDLPGDKLIGVFVATLGLAPHDEFHQVLRERLDVRYGNGYDYTYTYPGLQKVIQAAGRLIRTPEDSGVIELIDVRYGRKKVQALLPQWWAMGSLE